MLFTVIGHVLSATTPSHGSSPLLSNVQMLWVGLLVGLLVALLASEVIAWILVAISIAALGGLRLIGHHLGGTFATWLLVIAGSVVLGVIIGRVRGLKHLGVWEFGNRLAGIKKVSRF